MDAPEPQSIIEPTQQQVPSRQRKTSLIKPEFNWNIEHFDQENALKHLSQLANENLAIEGEKINPKLYIVDSSTKSTAINKRFLFVLKGQNQENENFQITRKYSDFHALREALVRRWPGCFIPPIPEKGNIGNTEKQVIKNKVQLITSFLNRMIKNEPIFAGQEFQIFLKSPQNQVEKLLDALKPHPLQDLYEIYRAAWPELFEEISDLILAQMEQKIKKFEDCFSNLNKNLVHQKDDIKRLAELRTKLTIQRYQTLEKALPEYQKICFNWFNGNTQPEEEQQKKAEEQEEQKDKEEEKKNKQEEDVMEKNGEELKKEEQRIYTHPRYQAALEAYKDELFPKEGENDDWLIYELFKYELREIESMMQAITTYRYLANEKKYYKRNIEVNKQQIQDLNNKKLSLKILLLSGSEDDKKNQLTNEIEILQTKWKVSEQLWSAQTQHVLDEIQQFQLYRCEFYKKSLMRTFKKQALYMARLLNLYLQLHKL